MRMNILSASNHFRPKVVDVIVSLRCQDFCSSLKKQNFSFFSLFQTVGILISINQLQVSFYENVRFIDFFPDLMMLYKNIHIDSFLTLHNLFQFLKLFCLCLVNLVITFAVKILQKKMFLFHYCVLKHKMSTKQNIYSVENVLRKIKNIVGLT